MPSAYEISFLEAIKIRRSTVTLAKTSPISDPRILNIVQHAIKYAPSPFHVQSCRAIVLFGKEHEKAWDIILETSRKNLPPPAFAQFESKFQSHKDSYGTVLFFEDSDAAKALPPNLQDLCAKNPDWAEHASGMNEFIAWTALCTEGLGCNLQHLQGFLEAGAREAWNIPETWSLRSQLVFGTPAGPPRGGIDKQFAPLDTRIKVYGSDKIEA
ncbi:hypothetical protein HK100_004272 [Physocladia obscura]|uniref:Nitroreductase domain-containing protein n=1 Tax=Physocladia obscura TaxID=109957 RepID=A0AAD5T8V5_9FUNG|nr:hypothetical protein HK100_004272 [Physocladia obscura]